MNERKKSIYLKKILFISRIAYKCVYYIFYEFLNESILGIYLDLKFACNIMVLITYTLLLHTNSIIENHDLLYFFQNNNVI